MRNKLLQSVITVDKYLKSEESWDDAVDRVFSMHARKFGFYDEEAADAVRQKLALPSMRTLQFGGAPVEARNLRAYNCSFSHCDRPAFFREAFYNLLCGTGVGFSVQAHHVSQLRPLPGPTRPYRTHFVQDTIEGWADALDALIRSYVDGTEQVKFNYSEVRPAGSTISSGTGLAPGHGPLEVALERIRKVLRKGSLRPIECFDIVMHAADAVLSGGVRRSATIALFSQWDAEMLTAKSGDWYVENPQRGRANISVVLKRNKATWEQYSSFALSVGAKQYGEPGVVFVDDYNVGVNPCSEIIMYPKYGKDTGWQLCNLSSVNGSEVYTKDDLVKAARIAARIGTYQAAYTDFAYLGSVSERITRSEALLGVSITGFCDNPELLFDPEVLREASAAVLDENAIVAKRIGIKPAARTCTVKPEGTASLVLGTASGIHAWPAERYIRNVQLAKNSPMAAELRKIAPETFTGPSAWNAQSDCYSFAVEAPVGAITEASLSALEQLRRVKLVQENWIDPGTRYGKLRHNVSNTIKLSPEEWEDAARFVYDNRKTYGGVAMLPKDNTAYTQAPHQTEFTEERFEALKQYNHLEIRAVTKGVVNFSAEPACAGGQCEIPDKDS